MDALFSELIQHSNYYFVLLLLAFLFLPVLLYLINGWAARRDNIFYYFGASAFKLYLTTFFQGEPITPHKDHRAAFEYKYYKRFGRRHYLIPMLFLLIFALLLLIMVSETVFAWLGIVEQPGIELSPIAVSALAGAYMWVLFDFIGRNRRLDLHPVDINRATFRLIIAVPFGIALGALAKDPAGVPLAFLAGAFPTTTLFTIARRLAIRQLGMGESAGKPATQLERLQCVPTANAERYADIGVTSISQLAYCDPIDVAIRSSFSFNYVVDCVSEALAWIYLEGDLAKARRYSMRGAQEITNLIDDVDGGTKASAARARKAIDALAKELKIDATALEKTLREIAGDPYTAFIHTVWA
jgi:hypothetical protein